MNAPGHPAAASLRRTPLHDWHREHGGRMVDFAGVADAGPVPERIVAEHLATRRSAGLFDVSHMGRFRFRGLGAEAALGRVLTNDSTALAPGRAHYTFIANERGGAEDDAYLYRLGQDDFLLVVNASNRAHDSEWLDARLEGDVRFDDESDTQAMIALQGPDSERLLEALVPAVSLPEAGRNRHAATRFDEGELLVARTGYTGERVCFELFADARRIENLWSRLVAAGAAPVGSRRSRLAAPPGGPPALRARARFGSGRGRDPDLRERPRPLRSTPPGRRLGVHGPRRPRAPARGARPAPARRNRSIAGSPPPGRLPCGAQGAEAASSRSERVPRGCPRRVRDLRNECSHRPRGCCRPTRNASRRPRPRRLRVSLPGGRAGPVAHPRCARQRERGGDRRGQSLTIGLRAPGGAFSHRRTDRSAGASGGLAHGPGRAAAASVGSPPARSFV